MMKKFGHIAIRVDKIVALEWDPGDSGLHCAIVDITLEGGKTIRLYAYEERHGPAYKEFKAWYDDN